MIAPARAAASAVQIPVLEPAALEEHLREECFDC